MSKRLFAVSRIGDSRKLCAPHRCSPPAAKLLKICATKPYLIPSLMHISLLLFLPLLLFHTSLLFHAPWPLIWQYMASSPRAAGNGAILSSRSSSSTQPSTISLIDFRAYRWTTAIPGASHDCLDGFQRLDACVSSKPRSRGTPSSPAKSVIGSPPTPACVRQDGITRTPGKRTRREFLLRKYRQGSQLANAAADIGILWLFSRMKYSSAS